MKILFACVCLSFLSSLCAAETKSYDFLSEDHLKYGYLFHIEVAGEKVEGDVTVAELDYFDQGLATPGTKPPLPTVATFTGVVEEGLKLRITFSPQVPYDAPEGHQKSTVWQLARSPTGMNLLVPMSVRMYPEDRAPYWEDVNVRFLDEKAALAARVAAKAKTSTSASSGEPISRPAPRLNPVANYFGKFIDNIVDSFKASSSSSSIAAQGIMSCRQCRGGDYVFQGKNVLGTEVTLSRPCPYCNGTGWLKNGLPHQP